MSCKSSSSSTGARLTERITAPGPFVCTALSPGETKEVGVTVIFSGGYGSGTTRTFCTWDAVRRRWSGLAVSARGNQQLTLAADMDSARRAPPFPMQVGGGRSGLFSGARGMRFVRWIVFCVASDVWAQVDKGNAACCAGPPCEDARRLKGAW